MLPPQPPADITIHVPLPNIDISERDFCAVKGLFEREGKLLSVKAEEVYPVAFSWVEIVIGASLFLGGAAANHYAEKLFEALDALLKKGIDRMSVNFRKGSKHSQIEVPRAPKDEAIAHLKRALEELQKE
jgi:hypothetical protein